jgi:hypothetical protein
MLSPDKLAALNMQIEKDIKDSKEKIKLLMQEDLLDEYGYPTEAALKIVEVWHWSDDKGWFDFIKSIWYLASWGWHEGDAIDEITGKTSYHYDISTAGWSGNESVIRSMEKNVMLWNLTWKQSRRGGHYIFELRDSNDD